MRITSLHRRFLLYGAAVVVGCATAASAYYSSFSLGTEPPVAPPEPEEEAEAEAKDEVENVEANEKRSWSEELKSEELKEETTPSASETEILSSHKDLDSVGFLKPKATKTSEALPADPAVADIKKPKQPTSNQDPTNLQETTEPKVVELKIPAVGKDNRPEGLAVNAEVAKDSAAIQEVEEEQQKSPTTPKPKKAKSKAKSVKKKPKKSDKERAAEVYLQLAERYQKLGSNRNLGFFARWSAGPSPEERRGGMQRLTCTIQAICLRGEDSLDITVTNLSLGGLELQVPELPGKGERLSISPIDCETAVTGYIVWSSPLEDRIRVGLELDQPLEELSQSWVALSLLEHGAEWFIEREPRKFVRVSIEIKTTLVLDDGETIEVTLLDLSLGGCLLQSAKPFEVNELTLGLGNVKCRGTIVNAREGTEEEGWLHHIRFQPLGRLEKLRLRKSLRSLLKAEQA